MDIYIYTYIHIYILVGVFLEGYWGGRGMERGGGCGVGMLLVGCAGNGVGWGNRDVVVGGGGIVFWCWVDVDFKGGWMWLFVGVWCGNMGCS